MGMKLKVDESGKPEYRDGLPVYVHDDGKEIPFDAERALGKISELNTENKKHREEKEESAKRVRAFEGIDPEAARKAIQTVGALEGDKAKFNEQLERMKAETNKAWEERFKGVEAELGAAKTKLSDTALKSAFSRSPYLSGDKSPVEIPLSFIESMFKSNFKVDNDRVTATGPDGNPIYSRRNPGAIAEFDEAIEILIDTHPERERILKPSQKPGAGTVPGAGTGGSGGSLKWSRRQYESASPQQRADFFAGGGGLAE
jgi:hypothetical protein